MARCLSKCVKISSLDKNIDIMTLQTTANDIGGRTQQWTVNTSIWAKLTPKTMNQLNEAGSLEFQDIVEILIRYNSTVFGFDKQKMRVRYGTRFMFVKSMINIEEADRFLLLKCVESDKAAVTEYVAP